MSPTSIIYEWFTKLPVEHRESVAFFTLTMLSGYPMTEAMVSDGRVDRFTEWLLNEEDTKQQAVGKALFLKAVIDFNLETRASDSSWDETAAFFKCVEASANEDGLPSVARDSAHEREKIALRKRQWKKSLAEWDELCTGPLSKEALSSILAP